jgi:nitrate/nitrite transport system permease protein
MVSAVFHSPFATHTEPKSARLESAAASSEPTTVRPEPVEGSQTKKASTSSARKEVASARTGEVAATVKAARDPFDWRAMWLSVLPPLFGLGLLIAIWAIVSAVTAGSIPTPLDTFKQAVVIFSDPFYRKGPNDQGVGWNILLSLERVAVGFGLAAAVGIPVGFAIGRFEFLSRMFNPLISLLRPVSPLAWLPIGLLVFKGANPAAIWTIFICSIWPMIINTAVGVQRVPQDYMNVAKVLNLSEWKIVTKILFPSVLPYMLTGVRLAVGTAWLVIVAAEMLTGGVGIGFWVWDEWNNLNVKNIIIAIFVIGIVGLILEYALIKLATAFTFEEVKN